MAVGDLKTEKGVKDLDAYLADRSYIEGWQASQADIAVLEALGEEPTPVYTHVLRWYKHIKSYDPKTLPGEKEATILKGTSATTPIEKPVKEADDEVDLFASDDEEDAEAAKVREERLKAYTEKKSKKPALIAKSSVVLDVKPWGDETDIKAMEQAVRSIEMDGLVWGASKLVPVGYGLNKLRIMCVVEDDKVSIDQLTEEIENFTELVQSVDIESFNKI